jgi:hypothetical protein
MLDGLSQPTLADNREYFCGTEEFISIRGQRLGILVTKFLALAADWECLFPFIGASQISFGIMWMRTVCSMF